jgi:hypothetical protein
MLSATSPLTYAKDWPKWHPRNTLAYYMGISTQDDHILALCLSLVTPDLRRIHHQLVSHLCWIDLNAGFDWRPSSRHLSH